MSDNVIPLRTPEDERKASLAAHVSWLRQLADQLESGEIDQKVAIAVFVKYEEGTDIMVGGFRDTTKALDYFRRVIDGLGFA